MKRFFVLFFELTSLEEAANDAVEFLVFVVTPPRFASLLHHDIIEHLGFFSLRV